MTAFIITMLVILFLKAWGFLSNSDFLGAALTGAMAALVLHILF